MASLSTIDILENSLRRRGDVLDILLLDMTRTTKTASHNIIWATDSYSHLWQLQKNSVQPFGMTTEINPALITGEFGTVIQPRAAKSKDEQQRRTKGKAEVFTPLSVVDEMNSSVWNSLHFSTTKPTWQDYVSAKWLEITCGEGPFIASRYDPTSFEQVIISPDDRVGFLDRKLRLVNANCGTPNEWLAWAEAALKSSYGYEWQGDNLLITRENILMTLNDFYKVKFEDNPNLESQHTNAGGLTTKQLEHFARIVVWNFFQMDGLKYIIPMSDSYAFKRFTAVDKLTQSSLFNIMSSANNINPIEPKPHPTAKPKDVVVMDWQTGKKIKFQNLVHTQ